MAYDPGTGQLILFGGQNANGNALGDTWIMERHHLDPASPRREPPRP